MIETVSLSAEQLKVYLARTGDFKPLMRKHGELAMLVQAGAGEVEKAPTMFSSKLRDRIQFRPGEVTAWAGYNGHRKSMFLGQVIADMSVQRKDAMVMSMEMSPLDTIRRIMRQMSGSEHPTDDWALQFAGWQRRLYIFDYQGRIDPNMCVAACRWAAENLHEPHIVIDSLMMVCGSEEHLDEQKQFVTDLVRFAQETRAHVHLVAHCRKPSRDGEDEPPSKYELRGSASISDQCHNVVTVWANKPKKAALENNPNDLKAQEEPDALVTVEKQRNGAWEGRIKLWFHEPSMRFCDDRFKPVEPYVLIN